MKVFKSLFAVAVISLCFASCSQHTTCSAYGASIYQIDNNQEEIHVNTSVESEEKSI